MRRVLIFVALLLDAAMLLLTPMSALAAMDATLSSSHARPGDHVLLLTEDYRGTWNYDGLSAESHQAIYLAATTSDPAQACSGPGTQMVGRLQWRGNAAGLSFIVPTVAFADYWVFMNTHQQCWRIGYQPGGLHQPLILTVGTSPADNQDVAKRWTAESLLPPKRAVPQSSSTPMLAITISSVLLLVALSLLALQLNRIRKRSSER